MGAVFELRHANIVIYLTSQAAEPPRLRERDLAEFVSGLSYGYSGRPPFISSDPGWVREMEQVARHASDMVRGWSDELLEPAAIEMALSHLRDHLSNYDFFGFVVGNHDDHDEITALARHLAYRTRRRAIFLIPVPSRGEDPVTVLDPLPALAPALEHRAQWPGLLFWSRSGLAAFAPVNEANELCERLLRTPPGVDGFIDDVLRSYRSRDRGIRLLHLSDLHYGRREAAENEALLMAELESQLDDVHRVIITGDLFDNPQREDQLLFRNFRAALLRRSRKDPIVVPGNHDQKWLGNLPANRRQIADLEWSQLVIDEHASCVFFCFDSSRDADLAKGRVSKDQLRDVGTAYQTAAVANSAIRDYLPIALVHHHPFSFESARETRVQRFLGSVGWSDERFLRMEDADQFVAWLARRDIPLVLHGHKHVQRYVEERVWLDKESRRLTAVGCGTSLGAEGYPVSYNIVAWDSVSKTWSASFYADPGDGSGFRRQCITSHSRAA